MIYFSVLSVLLHATLLLTWPTTETASHYAGKNSPISISLEPLHSGTPQVDTAFSETADQTGQQTVASVELFRSDKIIRHRISQQADISFPELLKNRQSPDLAQRDSDHTVSVTKPKRQVSENGPAINHRTGKLSPTKPKVNDIALLASATSGVESHYQNIQDTPSSAGASAIRSDILRSLNQAFAPYFRYPLLAQRRGWQGVVELGIHIKANGKLSRIWINRSSGHRILDKAAAKSLDQVTTLPKLDSNLSEGDLEMVLPVEYRLIDS